MRKLLGLVALAICGQASAGVIYNWETVDLAGHATTLTGSIEIEDSAWRLGSVNHVHTPVCPQNRCEDEDIDLRDPSNPVLSFQFRGQPDDGVT